jgi:hypothetical protein
MKQKTVAEILVETLIAAGVARIYGVVGDSLNGILEEIRRSKRLTGLVCVTKRQGHLLQGPGSLHGRTQVAHRLGSTRSGTHPVRQSFRCGTDRLDRLFVRLTRNYGSRRVSASINTTGWLTACAPKESILINAPMRFSNAVIRRSSSIGRFVGKSGRGKCE